MWSVPPPWVAMCMQRGTSKEEISLKTIGQGNSDVDTVWRWLVNCVCYKKGNGSDL